MIKKLEKDTVKIRREPPEYEFGGEVTLARLTITRGKYLSTITNQSGYETKRWFQKDFTGTLMSIGSKIV